MNALLLLAVLAAEPEPTPRRPVPLKEALTLAASKNFDLAAASAQADIVKAQANRVYTAILPDISLSASYVYTSAPAAFDLLPLVGLVGEVYRIPPVNLGAVPPPIYIQNRNSLFGTLLIQQILFAPQMWLIPAAKHGVEAARLGTLEAREQVLLNTARVYLGVQGLEQLQTAAHEAEAVAMKREKDQRAQIAAGMAVEVALLRAQTETAQARSTLAQLEGQHIALLSLLEALVGEPVRPVPLGTDELELGAAANENQQVWEQTYVIRAQASGLSAQQQFNTFDDLSWLPTLVGQAKGNYNSNTGFTGQNFTYDLIVALQFPLYDRGARYQAMHENNAKTAEAKARLEATKARAKATWIGAKANLEAAQAALAQAESQAALASRAQKQLESAVGAGVSTALELSDIDNKRFLAQSAAAQSRAQLLIRKVELAAAEGRLAKAAGLEEK